MSRTTPLHESHVAAGGELVDFAGWSLPLDYGSRIEEHHAVRRAAGVFDVSHLTVVDVEGEGVRAWLRTMLTNDVGRLDDGEALYGCLCNERGGIVDDVVVSRLGERRWRLILNAATRDKDLEWLEGHRPADVTVREPDALALLAVQGPEAVALAATALEAIRDGVPAFGTLPRFGVVEDAASGLFVSRTGCTGEDGVEIVLAAGEAPALWESLLGNGVRPCGLGARESLRLEAGMNLYGVDLDEAHTPIESGFAATVDLADPERAFIGREPIAEQRGTGAHAARVGLVLSGRGTLRRGQKVQLAGRDVGAVTSAAFGPTRGRAIAFARVERPFKGNCDVVVNARPLPARTAVVPFVRGGEASD